MTRQARLWVTIPTLLLSSGSFGQSLRFEAEIIPNLQVPAAPSFADGLNDSGVVVGGALLSPIGETFRPWMWSAPTGIVNLYPFAGLSWFASATDINNNGEVIGVYADQCLEPNPHPECPNGIIPASGVMRGVIWAADGSGAFVEIPSVAGDLGLDNLGVTPGAISNQGLIGASSQVRTPGEFSFGHPIAILWDQMGDPVQLGKGTIPGATIVNVADINDSRQYCGQISIGAQSRAFFYDPKLGYTVLPRLSDESLGPELAHGVALNDAGQVIGNASILHQQGDVVFTQHHGAFVWDQFNGMQNLGLYVVYDLNNHGQIVGSTAPGSAPGNASAALFDSGVWHVIQELTQINAADWHLYYAKAINNSGQIIVNAIAMSREAAVQWGEIHPFLLSPGKDVPGDLNGDGSVGVDDLLLLLQAWGPCAAPPQSCPADIAPSPNGDGAVDVDDLIMLLSNWS